MVLTIFRFISEWNIFSNHKLLPGKHAARQKFRSTNLTNSVLCLRSVSSAPAVTRKYKYLNACREEGEETCNETLRRRVASLPLRNSLRSSTQRAEAGRNIITGLCIPAAVNPSRSRLPFSLSSVALPSRAREAGRPSRTRPGPRSRARRRRSSSSSRQQQQRGVPAYRPQYRPI